MDMPSLEDILDDTEEWVENKVLHLSQIDHPSAREFKSARDSLEELQRIANDRLNDIESGLPQPTTVSFSQRASTTDESILTLSELYDCEPIEAPVLSGVAEGDSFDSDEVILSRILNIKLKIARQMNEFTPISLLPAELLSKIFLHYVDDMDTVGFSELPFMLVCFRWRALALNTPRLWKDEIRLDRSQTHSDFFVRLTGEAALKLHLPGQMFHAKRATEQLPYAKDLLKRTIHRLEKLRVEWIDYEGIEETPSSFFAFVFDGANARRLQHLRLSYCSLRTTNEPVSLPLEDFSVPNLRSLDLHLITCPIRLPAMSQLVSLRLQLPRSHHTFHFVFGLLASSSALEYLSLSAFRSVPNAHWDPYTFPPPLSLASLREVSLSHFTPREVDTLCERLDFHPSTKVSVVCRVDEGIGNPDNCPISLRAYMRTATKLSLRLLFPHQGLQSSFLYLKYSAPDGPENSLTFTSTPQELDYDQYINLLLECPFEDVEELHFSGAAPGRDQWKAIFGNWPCVRHLTIGGGKVFGLMTALQDMDGPKWPQLRVLDVSQAACPYGSLSFNHLVKARRDMNVPFERVIVHSTQIGPPPRQSIFKVVDELAVVDS